jgi:hypothetical protein
MIRLFSRRILDRTAGTDPLLENIRVLLENFRIALTPQRLAAILVTVVSTLVGAFAAQGMSMVQWIGGIVAVVASVAVAVIVHTWPAKAPVKAD